MKLKTQIIASVAAAATLMGATAAYADGHEAGEINRPDFTEAGEIILPENEEWREWVFIGTPLTPNALNGGEAAFPEFHNVYIEPSAYEYFLETGNFANGTQIAKELVLVREGDACEEDGSCYEVSGRGYFQGEFQGFEISYKDTERYDEEEHPGGWVYVTFGHQPQPYNETAAVLPAEACNACHESSADYDFVFTQFYPVLRAAMDK